MQRVVVAVAGLVLLSGVSGRASAQGPKLHPGVTAGVNFATWTGDDVGSNASRRTALMAGGTLGLKLSPAFTLQSGLVYSQEGTGIDITGANASIKVDYLVIPLEVLAGTTLRGTTPIRPYLLAGGRLGFKTRCKVEASSGGTSAEADCDDPSLQLDVKGTDFGLHFGAGVGVGRFTIGGRYTMGLTSIDGTGGGADVKNSVLALIAGFSL